MPVKDVQSAPCQPDDIGLKSFFLGPQSENAPWVEGAVSAIFSRWFSWRKRLYPDDGYAISDADQHTPAFLDRQRLFENRLLDLLELFEAEVPKFSPRYVGHMFSELCLPGLLGHIAALLHNPNNISRESSRVGIQIETEAIASLAAMVGYPVEARGHFTSGGTIANLEALIRARDRSRRWVALGEAIAQRNGKDMSPFSSAHMGWQAYEKSFGEFFQPSGRDSSSIVPTNFDPIILCSSSCHYSWQKGVHILGLGKDAFWPVPIDRSARMSTKELKIKIERARSLNRPILMVVSVAGTTELGQFDPIDEINELLADLRQNEGCHIWHHVDAAYGGFFCALGSNTPSFISAQMDHALTSIREADSLTLDPHKLGYVPYASGVTLVKDSLNYSPMSDDVPYLHYRSNDPGPFTVEGSRPATGASATWMIAKTIGFSAAGYGRILARTIRVRQNLQAKLLASELPIRIAPGCDSNILCFTIAQTEESLSETNNRIERIYSLLSPDSSGPFFVAKTAIHGREESTYFEDYTASWEAVIDCDNLVLIRMCLLNPFFDSKEMDTDFGGEFLRHMEGLYLQTLGASL